MDNLPKLLTGKRPGRKRKEGDTKENETDAFQTCDTLHASSQIVIDVVVRHHGVPGILLCYKWRGNLFHIESQSEFQSQLSWIEARYSRDFPQLLLLIPEHLFLLEEAAVWCFESCLSTGCRRQLSSCGDFPQLLLLYQHNTNELTQGQKEPWPLPVAEARFLQAKKQKQRVCCPLFNLIFQCFIVHPTRLAKPSLSLDNKFGLLTVLATPRKPKGSVHVSGMIQMTRPFI